MDNAQLIHPCQRCGVMTLHPDLCAECRDTVWLMEHPRDYINLMRLLALVGKKTSAAEDSETSDTA